MPGDGFVGREVTRPVVRIDRSCTVTQGNGSGRKCIRSVVAQAVIDVQVTAAGRCTVQVHHAVGDTGVVDLCRDRTFGTYGFQIDRAQLAHFTHDAVGADREDRREVSDLVIGCDAAVVDDRHRCTGDPVAYGVTTGALQVGHGRATITFDHERHDFVGAIRTVLIVKIIQRARVVIRPTWAAPGGEHVEKNRLTLIEQVVEVPVIAIDIGRHDIRGDGAGAIWA